MNRSMLNGARLGSGNALPWVTGAATQAMRLIGSLAVGVVKYGRAAGSLTLTPHLRILSYVRFPSSGTLTLTGAAIARAWVKTYGVMSQALSIFGYGRGVVQYAGSGDGTLALSGTAIPRKLTAVHGDGGTTFTLTTSNLGGDYATDPAPEDRTTGIVEIKTQTTDSVGIGA